MAQLTIELPDELVQKLEPVQNQLPDIIELGLRHIGEAQNVLQHEVITFFAGGPSLNEIVAFRPSVDVDERLAELLDKNRLGSLTDTEQSELDMAELLNHVVTLVKLRARQQLL